MATITKPVVTRITSTGANWTIADFLTQLFDHFDATSTLWQVDHVPSEDATGAEGFTLSPQGVETFQLNIRYSSATSAKVILDPDGTITASGGNGVAPTGASVNASGEGVSGTTGGLQISTTASSVALILEWSDAIMILVESATNTYMSAFHAGRVLTPIFADDATRGYDGLAIFGGPLYTLTNAGYFFPGTGGAWCFIRRLNSGVEADDWSNEAYPLDANPVSNPNYLGGVYMMEPFFLRTVSTNTRLYGPMKYLYRSDADRVPKTRLEDNATVAQWMHVGTTTDCIVVPWPNATAP